MPDKKAEWSDYAYDNDSIAKRLGISKDEVEKLKSEGKSDEQTLATTGGPLGVGVSLDFENAEDQTIAGSIKLPGAEITIDANGNGKIDLLNLIKVSTTRKGCFYIQRFYLAGQFLFSDIQKVDSEECNDKEPEPIPEPIPEPEPPKPRPPRPPRGSTSRRVNVLVAFNYFRVAADGGISSSCKTVISNISVKNYILDCDIRFDAYEAMPAYVNKIRNYPINGLGMSLSRSTPYGSVRYYIVVEHQSSLILPVFLFVGSEIAVDSLTLHDEWNISGDLRDRYLLSTLINLEGYVQQPTKNPPINPPINSEKKEKKMEKDCCEKSDKLLKRLAKYQGLGQKIKPINVKDNKIEEKGNKDDNFPMKIPKRWIDREAKPKDDYEVENMRHLILSVGIMLDRFEELFNPAGKDNGFPLKKPEEGLWKWLPGDGGDYEAPDPDYDPKKSKDDGKIKNKKLKIETYLDLFRYFLESQIRLELLFPIAQIRDSEISKRLIYPKAPGTIKINDLIQFQELMLLFINKTLGDPSGAVIIKDADPTQEGAQPITIENFDISDMLRKLLRFSVDINSDIDLTNNFSKRTLYQLLSAMQVLVKNHEMTEAIFEDLGMKEEQTFVPVKFFADPYAGAWKAGEGFDPKKVKVENSEAAIEANLGAFLQETEVEVKVSRRAKDETTDIRDLLAQIGRYAAELAAMGKIPNNPEAIQQAIDKARFELQTESALRRTDVRQASAAGRVRTKRNKPKGK